MTLPGPPKIHPIFQKLGTLFLKINGWQVEGSLPATDKFVMIGAPHTSNWDFFYMLACLGQLGVYVRWMGKDALFRGPMGWVMVRLGGIPIDRTKRNNAVQQIVQEFAAREKLVIGILPEGTRKKRDSWKTGFYYIAQAAEVPIVICSVDYRRKVATAAPPIPPTADLAEVMTTIREFMDGVQGKYPENASDIRVSAAEITG